MSDRPVIDTVEAKHLGMKRFHGRRERLRTSPAAAVTAPERKSCPPALVLESPQLQADFRLLPLDAQIGHEYGEQGRSLSIPEHQRLKGLASTSLSSVADHATRASEVLVNEVNRLRLDLADRYALAVRRLSGTMNAHRPRFPLDPDAAVGVDDPGRIGEHVGTEGGWKCRFFLAFCRIHSGASYHFERLFGNDLRPPAKLATSPWSD